MDIYLQQAGMTIHTRKSLSSSMDVTSKSVSIYLDASIAKITLLSIEDTNEVFKKINEASTGRKSRVIIQQNIQCIKGEMI